LFYNYKKRKINQNLPTNCVSSLTFSQFLTNSPLIPASLRLFKDSRNLHQQNLYQNKLAKI
jgi:hypothetical protein